MKNKAYVTKMVSLLFLISIQSSLFADVVSHAVEADKNQAFESAYNDDSQWPTKAEIINLKVPDSDSALAKSVCERWLRIVLNDKWIPKDLHKQLCGLKRFAKEGDVLVAEYDLQGYKFRIKDSASDLTVMISSSSLVEDPAEWAIFISSLFGQFLNESERVMRFKTAHLFSAKNLMRVDFLYDSYGFGEPGKRYWWSGNPALWKNKGSVVLVFTKLLCGNYRDEGDDDFGVLQRFPPLSQTLHNGTLDDIVKCLVGDSKCHEDLEARRRIAIEVLRKRNDHSDAIKLLTVTYKKTDQFETKISILKALNLMLSAEQDTSSVFVATFCEDLLKSEGDASLKREASSMLSMIRRRQDIYKKKNEILRKIQDGKSQEPKAKTGGTGTGGK